MTFQIYLKRGRWREALRAVEQMGLTYVLETGVLDTSRSPIAAALELEDPSLEALALPRVGPGEFQWYVMLADAMGVRRLVLPPPPAMGEIAAIYNTAAEYGVEVNWLYGVPPMSRIKDVEAVARAIRPTAARVVYDPVKARGMKEIYTTIVALGGYIREIYLSNRRGQRGPRLPPFDPVGVINYVEILQALQLLQWEGRYTIRQAPQYLGELELQVRIGGEVIEVAKNAGVSKKVRRRVSTVLNELMYL
ncbi:MAG: hypothetical protein ACK4SY_07900 [Pyrobaculum sp.]